MSHFPSLVRVRIPAVVALALWLGAQAFGAVAFVKAKGSGTVTIAINGYSSSFSFSGSTSQWNEPSSYGATSGTSAAVVDGVEYLCSATSIGVVDFVISFESGPQDYLHVKRRMVINDRQVDAITKSEIVANSFRIKQDWLSNVPFGVMDDTQAQVQRRIVFGMGADSADSPAGILMYEYGTHLGYVRSMRFFKGPGTLWSNPTSGRIQARSSFGFMDAIASGNSWIIRYYKDRGPGNPFPFSGGFHDFAGAIPLTTYQLDASNSAEAWQHPDSNFTLRWGDTMNISRTVGSDTRVREIQTSHYSRRVLSAAYYEGGYPYQYWTERYMNWEDSIVRAWPWRRSTAARGALTESTVKVTYEEVIQQGPAGRQVTFHPTDVVEKRYHGAVSSSSVLSQTRRGYSGIEVLQSAVPPTGVVAGVSSEEMSIGGFRSDVGPNGVSWLPGGNVRTDARGGQTFTEVYRRPTWSFAGNLNGQPLGALGKPRETRKSFGDNPTGSPSDIISSYEYVELWDGVRTLPWRVITRQNGIEIGREVMSYVVGSFGGQETTQTTATTSSSSSQTLMTVTKRYSPRALSLDLRDKPLSVTRPDGTKSSFAYERGVLWNGQWTPATQPPPTSELPAGAHLLVAELIGKTGTGVGSFTPSSGSAIAIDALDLEANRSLVSEKIFDSLGKVVRESTYLYTGGAGFALLDATYHSFDPLGRLIRSADTPTATSASRVFYEASYLDAGGNLSWSMQWERDAQGSTTVLVCDDYGRVVTATRESSGTPGQSDFIPARVTTSGYDGADRLVSQVVGSPAESDTLATAQTHDTLDRLRSTTSPGGYVTTINFDSPTQTTSIAKGRDPVNNPQDSRTISVVWKDGRKKSTSGNAVPDVSIAYSYDAAGNLITTETASTGAWSRSVTDWIGRVVQVEKPTWAASDGVGISRVETNEFNTIGQLVATGAWQGATLLAPRHLREYDAYGRLLREGTDSNNNGSIEVSSDMQVVQHHFMYETRTMGWFDTGQPIHVSAQWYLFQAELIWAYAPDLEPGATDRSGEWRSGSQLYRQVSGLTRDVASHEFGHDAVGNWTQAVVALDPAAQRVITERFVTGSSVRPRTVKRAGFEVEQRNPQGQVTLNAFDGLGRMTAMSEQRISIPTTYAYVDGTTLVESVSAPDGKTTSFGYDLLGRKNRETTAANNKSARYRYDEAGNLTHTWGDIPPPVMQAYNDLGQRTSSFTYRGGSWSGASLPGDFDSAVNRDPTIWTYHGPTGLMQRKTDARGRATEYQFDGLNRVSRRNDSRGGGWYTTYEYYGLANSNVAGGEFQGGLKKVDYTDPAGTPDVSYTYERRGRPRTVTDAAGTRTFNYYDSWTPGSPTESRDRSGLLQGESLPAFLGYHAVSRDYQFSVGGLANGAPSALEIDNSATYRVAYAYDDRLRPASVGYMNDTPFSYGYVAGSNLLDTVTQGTAGSYTYLRDSDYETNSNRRTRLLQRARPDGGGDAQQVESHLGHNDVGLRLWEKTRGTGFSAMLRPSSLGIYSEFTYSDRRELGTNYKWEMDGAWNPVTALPGAARTFLYDPIGNRTSDQAGSYAPTVDNRYTATPYGPAPAYDDSGNMTSDGLGRACEYDGENRLIKVTQGGLWVSFAYDHLGRRISRTTSGGGDTRFLHDGWNVVAELNGSGAIARRFVWGLDASGSLQGAGGVGGLLVIDQAGARHMPFYDASFNVIGLYDGAGAISAAYEYDPFGNLLQKSGGFADANPFRHATKYVDAETEIVLGNGTRSYLAYYGHRFYHTAFGRFVNRDPIAETGGLNLYGFCGNDAVNRWDLLGMEASADQRASAEQAEAARKAAEQDAQRAARRGAQEKLDRDIISKYGISNWLGGVGRDDKELLAAADVAGVAAYNDSTQKSALTETLKRVDATMDHINRQQADAAQKMAALDFHQKLQSKGTGTVAANSAAPGNPNVQPTVAAGGGSVLGGIVSGALNVIGKVWNLPNTVIGVTVGLVGYGVGKIMGTDPGISFGHNGIEFTNNPAMFLGGAITLGNAIIYAGNAYRDQYGIPAGSTPAGDGLHEQQHTYQGQILGPAYLPAAGLSLLLGTLLDGDSHGPHSFMEKGPQMTPPQPWP